MFEFQPTKIPGLTIIKPRLAEDERGRFVKILHKSVFVAHGMSTDFSESYYSISRKHVLRGMHFQNPPYECDKLVHVVNGSVIDIVLDLKIGSPSYADFNAMEIDGESRQSLYIPAGCAHGFMCLSDHATLLYYVTKEHAPHHDTGIRWDSFGFDWGARNLIISARDEALPPLVGFQSPFPFQGSTSAS